MDIDIDIKPKTPINNFLPIIRASMLEKNDIKPHPVGYYLQNIPQDKITNLAAIPYDKAEDFGYIKIDILNLHLLEVFESREEIKAICQMQPDWSLLQKEDIVKKLFHIKNHFHVVSKCHPKSVDDLADVLAIIRPNKIQLLDKYLKDKKTIRPILYHKHADSDLRKSHAYAYALNIIIQMNLLKLGIEI